MKLTPVQKRVIKFLADQGGTGILLTGHRTTVDGTCRKTGDPALGISLNVLAGLMNNDLVELVSHGPPRYKLLSPNVEAT